MLQGFGTRTVTAIGLVVIAAVAVFLLEWNLQAAIIALVGGIAAVMVILFHFSSHGWNVGSTGNQHHVQVNK